MSFFLNHGNYHTVHRLGSEKTVNPDLVFLVGLHNFVPINQEE